MRNALADIENNKEDLLISGLYQGDEASFKTMVNLYKDRVFNTCLGFLKNIADAEDISQEVFIEVYQSIRQFKGDSSLTTWIYRIAVNKSLEQIRKSKRKKRFAIFQTIFHNEKDEYLNQHPDFEHPGVIAENKEKADLLMSAIDKLLDTQRTAFTLHKIEGLSYQEISEVMELSFSAVESLIHRAKKNLKKILYQYYYDNEA